MHLVFRTKMCVCLCTDDLQSMCGFCSSSDQPAWGCRWMALGSAWGGADFGLFQSLEAKDNFTMLTGVLVSMCLDCFSRRVRCQWHFYTLFIINTLRLKNHPSSCYSTASVAFKWFILWLDEFKKDLVLLFKSIKAIPGFWHTVQTWGNLGKR